jgi:hypothetical protein
MKDYYILDQTFLLSKNSFSTLTMKNIKNFINPFNQGFSSLYQAIFPVKENF